MPLTRPTGARGARSLGDQPMSDLTKRLVADGLKPAIGRERDLALYEIFFGIAVDVLKSGAPGIAEPAREAIARSISLRCERATLKRKEAA